MWDDPGVRLLLMVVGGMLLAGSVLALALRLLTSSEGGRALATNVWQRTASWWLMVLVVLIALSSGHLTTMVLFAGISFLALREFVSIMPTRRGDHRTLFWAFFVVLPLHYILLGTGWTGMFMIFIPVYAFIFFAVRSAISDDPTHFLTRVAEIHWSVMVCVYAISHVPALLILPMDGYAGEPAALVLFFLIIVQGNDVLQYCWGKCLGRHKVLPHISPNKTWEGLIGGVISSAAIGAVLSSATPFAWHNAALLAGALALVGFFGDITLSAIKRDAGIKDYGELIAGHGGILDRVDSLCLAAPVFFHIVRFYHTP